MLLSQQENDFFFIDSTKFTDCSTMKNSHNLIL